MVAPHDARVSDLERRVSNAVIIGTVSEVDAKKYRYRVKSGGLETDWLPMASPRAGDTRIYSSLNKGEQVIVAAPGGDLAQGVIVGSVATNETQAGDKANIHRTEYPDGTAVEYDHDAKSFKMDVADGGSFTLAIGGGVTLSASGGALTISAPDGIALEGPSLTHNGTDISDKHVHSAVKAGPDNTGAPV